MWNFGGTVNLLSLRRDPRNQREADTSTAANPIPNPTARGNVLFCDGHVNYIERQVAHTPEHGLGFP